MFSAKDVEVPTPGTCNYDLVGKCDPAKVTLGPPWGGVAVRCPDCTPQGGCWGRALSLGLPSGRALTLSQLNTS